MKASAVVLTAIPFGYGNLRNLETAKKGLERGIPTFVIEKAPIGQRDFTKGKAKERNLLGTKMNSYPYLTYKNIN